LLDALELVIYLQTSLNVGYGLKNGSQMVGTEFRILGIAACCWAIWKARNDACFNRRIIKSPLDIIYHCGALIRFWAGLYSDEDKAQIAKGVDLLIKAATEFLDMKKAKVSSSTGDQDVKDQQGA